MAYTIDNVLADALKVATDMARTQQTAQVLEELGGLVEAAKRLDEAQKREDER